MNFGHTSHSDSVRPEDQSSSAPLAFFPESDQDVFDAPSDNLDLSNQDWAESTLGAHLDRLDDASLGTTSRHRGQKALELPKGSPEEAARRASLSGEKHPLGGLFNNPLESPPENSEKHSLNNRLEHSLSRTKELSPEHTLGSPLDLEKPPKSRSNAASDSAIIEKSLKIDPNAITEDEGISKAGEAEIKKIEKTTLGRGDTASYYDEIRAFALKNISAFDNRGKEFLEKVKGKAA